MGMFKNNAKNLYLHLMNNDDYEATLLHESVDDTIYILKVGEEAFTVALCADGDYDVFEGIVATVDDDGGDVDWDADGEYPEGMTNCPVDEYPAYACWIFQYCVNHVFTF